MIICEICKKEYKIITNQHLQKHSTNEKEYKNNYPNSPLICEETRKKYRDGTIKYISINGSPKKGKPLSEEHKEKLKKIASNRTKEHYDKIFQNKERNIKIGKAKKIWWDKKSAKERSDFIINKVIPKMIENEGKDNYHKRLRKIGIKGHNIVREKGKKKISNLFEKQMIEIIKNKGFACIEQFELGGYYYDSYIPEKKLIIEFDGDYWHPKTIEDCVNNRLKNQWRIDRIKDSLAEKNGYKLIRIRESEKNSIYTII
jgi:very-short-patch-repair endonuclease